MKIATGTALLRKYYIPAQLACLIWCGSCVLFEKIVRLTTIGPNNTPNYWYWSRGYKTFSMLTSAEHEINPAHKRYNANNCWHFNNYEHDKYNI